MFNSYHSILIAVTLVVLYLISNILVKKNIISFGIHRKIWNSFLAIFFLLSAGLGFGLAIMLDLKSKIDWYSGMLWFHVEFGIGMATIAIFHLIWHLSYYFPKKVINNSEKIN